MCVRFEPATASQKAPSEINAKSVFQRPTMVLVRVVAIRLFWMLQYHYSYLYKFWILFGVQLEKILTVEKHCSPCSQFWLTLWPKYTSCVSGPALLHHGIRSDRFPFKAMCQLTLDLLHCGLAAPLLRQVAACNKPTFAGYQGCDVSTKQTNKQKPQIKWVRKLFTETT